MFLTLITLASAQDFGATQFHLGIQAINNDPFVSGRMGTLSVSRDLSDWLGIELGGGLAPLPREADWKALTNQLTRTEIYPDIAYLQYMGWTGVRVSPLRNEWKGLTSQVGLHLGVAAIQSVEAASEFESDSHTEVSPASRYGVHSNLSWGRFGIDLSLTRTGHQEEFGLEGESEPYTASRQNIWVHGGLSCRL